MLVLRNRLIHVLLDPRVARWLLAIYALGVLAIVFQPFPHAAVGSVDLGYRVVRAVHLTWLITPIMVEFAWNIVMFVPLTFLGSVIFRRVTWEQWVGLAMIASAGIEFTQLVALPDRSATVADIVSNTIGGLIGALAARALVRSQEQQRAPIG